MKRLTKKKILIGLIILLVLINISAIVTMGIDKLKDKKDKQEYYQGRKHNKNPHFKVKRFIRKELNLSDEQFNKYCQMKDKNIENTKIFIDNIKRLRTSTINEISLDNPDSIKLSMLSDTIGQMHSQIQNEMNRHFIELKTILNKEQAIKLADIMHKMDERFRVGKKHWHRWKNKNNSNQKNNKK